MVVLVLVLVAGRREMKSELRPPSQPKYLTEIVLVGDSNPADSVLYQKYISETWHYLALNFENFRAT